MVQHPSTQVRSPHPRPPAAPALRRALQVLGHVAPGFPPVGLPVESSDDLDDALSLVAPALAMGLMSFVETAPVAKKIAQAAGCVGGNVQAVKRPMCVLTIAPSPLAPAIV